jgi:hypothetical protein
VVLSNQAGLGWTGSIPFTLATGSATDEVRMGTSPGETGQVFRLRITRP